MSNSEHGLVNQYLTRVCQLAVRAQNGEDIAVELLIAVREAQDHFLLVKDSNPASTLESFIGQLRFKADRVDPSQPVYAETLRRASSLASRASTEPDV